jgi:hypothetical protein
VAVQSMCCEISLACYFVMCEILFIDDWNSIEYPTMIPPIHKTKSFDITKNLVKIRCFFLDLTISCFVESCCCCCCPHFSFFFRFYSFPLKKFMTLLLLLLSFSVKFSHTFLCHSRHTELPHAQNLVFFLFTKKVKKEKKFFFFKLFIYQRES